MWPRRPEGPRYPFPAEAKWNCRDICPAGMAKSWSPGRADFRSQRRSAPVGIRNTQDAGQRPRDTAPSCRPVGIQLRSQADPRGRHGFDRRKALLVNHPSCAGRRGGKLGPVLATLHCLTASLPIQWALRGRRAQTHGFPRARWNTGGGGGHQTVQGQREVWHVHRGLARDLGYRVFHHPGLDRYLLILCFCFNVS